MIIQFISKSGLFVISALLVVFTLSCNAPEEPSANVHLADTASTDSIENLVALENFGLYYAKAWESKNPKSVADFFAEDGSLRINQNDPAVGREAIIKVVDGFMTSFPDLKLKMDKIVPSINGASFYWTFKGTFSGPGGNGNEVNFSGVEKWAFNDDNLIKTSIGTFNEEEYNQQIGK